MAEKETISKLIIEMGGKEYELDGGGGGCQPGPNTVGTEQIIDGAVEEQDLHDDVKDRMTITHDSATGGLRIGGYAKPGDIPADSEPVGGTAEEDTEETTKQKGVWVRRA